MFLDQHMAKAARSAKEPWSIRVENGSQFWMASGIGAGPVEIRWGKIGREGSSLKKDWPYALKKLNEKLTSGYVYVDGTKGPSATVPKTGNQG